MASKQGGGRRILVVEDDPATLALLERRLKRAGYEVIGCCNGKEAATELNRSRADIIIADWEMPEVTGIELCRMVSELRETSPLRAPHFILLTAHAEREKVVQAFECGADDFVRKPYDIHELLARVRAAERILNLQEQLVERQLELSKSNARLALLNRKLEKLASTDSVTDLPNRRCTMQRLEEAWALAQRSKCPLACVMADVDHFKLVNDRHGHAAGDLILHKVAQRIRRTLRRYDVCGRFGGEEFLVVCPDTDVSAAVQVGERIRMAVADRPIHHDSATIAVTVSLGVSWNRPAHQRIDQMLAEADTLLYRAKQAGRNQTWYADEHGTALPALSPAQTSA